MVQTNDLAWTFDGSEPIEGAPQDLKLIVRIERLASGVPQGIVDEDRAGRPTGLDNVERARQGQGRKAFALEVAGDQTHGLVADRSHRHQEHGVDRLALESTLQGGNELLAHASLRVDPAHAREQIIGERPDRALELQGAKRF